MAERRLVLCEPLCFIASKYKKVGIKSIKSVALDYFRPEDIYDAKMKLMDDIKLIQSTKNIPYVSKRRDGENKTARELDDIFTLITALDDQKLIQQLPMYVTDNPDNLPTTRLFEGDLSVIFNKLEQFDSRINAIGSALSAIMKDFQQVARTQVALPDWPALPVRSAGQGASYNGARPKTFEPQRSMTSSVNNNNNMQASDQLIPDGVVWSTVTSTPQNHCVRGSTSEASECDDADGTFTTVLSRSRKRQRQSTANGRSPHQAAAGTTNTRRRGPLVIGRAASSSLHGVQAARQYPGNRPDDRAIFYIDNVNVQHSDQDIRALAESMGVRVLSCFEVRPRRRRRDMEATSPNTEVAGRKAFRLCIRDQDRDTLLSPGKWPAFVTVSEWYTKTNTRGRGNQRASSASDPAPARSDARSDTIENQTTSDRVTDGNSHTASVAPAGNVGLPAASVAVDTSVAQQIPVANSFSVLNDMECSDEGGDDTVISIVDRSAIITTCNDGV